MFFFFQAFSQRASITGLFFGRFGRIPPQNFAAQNRAPWVIVEKHAQIPSFWSLDWTRFSRVFKRSWLGNPTSRRAIKKGTLKFGRVKFVSHQQPHLGTVKCPVDRVQPRHYQFMMWTIWIVTFAGHKLKDLTICDLSKWTTHTHKLQPSPTFSGIPVSGIRSHGPRGSPCWNPNLPWHGHSRDPPLRRWPWSWKMVKRLGGIWSEISKFWAFFFGRERGKSK